MAAMRRPTGTRSAYVTVTARSRSGAALPASRNSGVRITEEMWLPWRKEANRPRAGALQKRTCPAGLRRMTGSGKASAMTCIAAFRPAGGG